jgi:hypothetical protein
LKLGVSRAVALDDRVDERRQQRTEPVGVGFLDELKSLAQRAAREAAHHITLSGVRWIETVEGEKDNGADVVGDHPHRLASLVVGRLHQRLDASHDRPQEVDAEHVGGVGGCHAETLETAAEVHVALRQRDKAVVGPPVLHEDGVPDLEVAPAVTVRVAILAERLVVLDLREEVEHLRVRPTRLARRHPGRRSHTAPPAQRLVIEIDARTTVAGPRRPLARLKLGDVG